MTATLVAQVATSCADPGAIDGKVSTCFIPVDTRLVESTVAYLPWVYLAWGGALNELVHTSISDDASPVAAGRITVGTAIHGVRCTFDVNDGRIELTRCRAFPRTRR